MMILRLVMGFSVLAGSLTISASAQATGMDALHYYVGTWTCKGAPQNEQGFSEDVSTGTATYTLENGVLHERLVIPAKGAQTKAYTLNVRTTYDAAKERYVSASVDSNENWSVMYAPPFLGDKLEHWTDHQTSSGKQGRSDVIRYTQTMFATFSFPTTQRGARADFRSFCHRNAPKAGAGPA
jgi:hypothetical protein